jgi:hypothetical protein
MVRAGVLLAVLGAGGPAGAATADFLGLWTDSDADASGIAQFVIAPGSGAGQLDVQLLGKCQPKACDWGSHPTRLYADDPASRDIRTVSAEFDAGGMHKHVVLHLAVGGALRFEVLTDFGADASRSSFFASGNVQRTGDWRAAVQVAAAAPPPVAPASGGATVLPPPPPPSGNGWFGDLGTSSAVGVGPALPPGYVPSKWEECTPFNLDQVRAATVDGNWRVGDFSHRLLSFGSSHDAALRALQVLNFYHFDEQCVVTRGATQMMYWKRAGAVPKDDMPGDDCDAIDPAAVKAVESEGSWSVTVGGRTLLAFDDDKDAAARAVSVIRTYKLNHQCFFARGNPKAQFWLAQ